MADGTAPPRSAFVWAWLPGSTEPVVAGPVLARHAQAEERRAGVEREAHGDGQLDVRGGPPAARRRGFGVAHGALVLVEAAPRRDAKAPARLDLAAQRAGVHDARAEKPRPGRRAPDRRARTRHRSRPA